MKKVHIKDICTKGSSALKQKDLLENGDYPVYGASGIAGYLNEYHQDKEYIAVVKDGSGIGRVSFQEPQSSVIGTMQYILPKEGYNIRYIGYCLQSLDLAGYKQGAAIPHIYFRDYGERVVNVTDDKAEQQAIVSRLDAAFAKIDAVKANAEKQLNDAKALFQKELSKAMTPKEGWERKKLGEIAKIKIGPFGSLIHKRDYVVDGIPLVNPVHLENGRIKVNRNFTISKGKVCELLNYILKENDIVFARRGEIGRCAIVTAEEEGFVCGTGSMFIRTKISANCKFLLILFQSDKCQEYLVRNAIGATMLNINANILDNMHISLPPPSEQQAIVTHLDTLSEKLKTVEERQKAVMAECDAMKQALLREVFE